MVYHTWTLSLESWIWRKCRFALGVKGLKPGDYKKHLYDKCRFPLYFILTARNAILSGGYLLPHYISVSIYLVACEQALLGVGDGRGKEDTPPRELARRLSIWGNWRCWRLSQSVKRL